MRTASMKLLGHPDKICDLVAEAIVDEYMKRDPQSRIRLNVIGGHGALFISGDVSSQADFDVAALVRRVVGERGVQGEIEPFVSLEAMSPERAAVEQGGSSVPVTVTGFATDETPELVPETVALALRVAKKLEEYRQLDEQGFWLGGDGEVSVAADQAKPSSISLLVEHGSRTLPEAREALANVVRSLAPGLHFRVNDAGPTEARGLSRAAGSSGRELFPYGSLVPATLSGSGLDPYHPSKSGSWIARMVAKQLVKRGARAVMVHALYHPGEKIPARVLIRDERGKDLSKEIERAQFSIDRAVREWWRPDLSTAATRWGLVGEPTLPWEM
jgi:S-adenosylmethionine synthetase